MIFLTRTKKAITDFKCSVRKNGIKIIKNGNEKLFFNKTFTYQVLNEKKDEDGFNLDEMQQELKKSKINGIVNYGIKTNY